MTTAATSTTFDPKVHDFLAQRRIAVAGVSRDGSHPSASNLIRRVWMHQSIGRGSSVSPEAVEYCRQHDISVIAGACPMMYVAGVDFGHRCMRWILKFTGGLPT